MPCATPELQRAYQREWVARRRAAWFANKACEWCGKADRLELHHRDPGRKVANAIWSWSKARRDTEIAKCLVLCFGCHKRAHREAHRLEAELRNPHGTEQRYRLGCSCRDCRAGHAEYNRLQKQTF